MALRLRLTTSARLLAAPLACCLGLLAGAFVLLSAAPARATPSLVVDAATGQVLHAEDATRPWYPASLTKLMTVYVALQSVQDRRLTMQTPLVVSNRAARMSPSKMGFAPGSEVTLENALKIIMVKSANDVSVTIAEGIAGSVPAFAAQMNAAAQSLGMTHSNFVNPHGLHHEEHISSARDMALLARGLLAHFPQHEELYGIGALKLGKITIPTHNGLLGRYPGADGMKTGFVCASGFNVVASASRSGRRLIAVVMGSPNAKARTLKAMALFEGAFSTSVFARGGGNIANLPASSFTQPVDLRPQVCGKNRSFEAMEDFAIPIAATGANPGEESAAAFFAAETRRNQPGAPPAFAGGDLGPRPAFTPVPIYLGRAPGWTGIALRPVDDEAALTEAELGPGKKAQARAKARQAARAKALAAKADKEPAQTQGSGEAKKPQGKPAPKPGAKPGANSGAKPGAKPPATAGQNAGQKPAPKPVPKPAPKPAPKPLDR